jgi:hypothetical protein
MRLALLLTAFLAVSPLAAASPFAPNLKGLKVLLLDINGDEAAAKKAGVPFKELKAQLAAQISKAGLKVVSSAKDAPKDAHILPAELMLGLTTHSGFTSYALTLQVYEPMRVEGKDRLYVAWTNMTYGFAPKESLKAQVKEQVKGLGGSLVADWKKGR